MKPARATARPDAAFTLLEVILAVTIFGLTMVAITSVMRTGARSWTIGHAMTELMQNVRVTQDVVLRDLNNICYRPETAYNQTFRGQIERMGSEILLQSPLDPRRPYKNFNAQSLDRYMPNQRNRRRTDKASNANQIFLDQISPPIDLSFRGSDNGDTDRLSFVRRQSADWTEPEKSTLGLRRITYYVKDKVLWREESDPYGFRPGSGLASFIATLDPGFAPMDLFDEKKMNTQLARGGESPLSQLTQFFAAPNDPTDAEDKGRGQFLPGSVHYKEQVCQGVVTFNVTYGYFLEGQWVEVGNWDSNAMQYRNPLDRDYYQSLLDSGQMDESAVNSMILGRTGTRFSYFAPRTESNYSGTPIANPSLQVPDDLPGYVAIQIGVTSPGLKGRVYTFTIFQAMPVAEETDVRFDPNAPLAGSADANYKQLGYRRHQRSEDRLSRRFDRSSRGRRY